MKTTDKCKGHKPYTRRGYAVKDLRGLIARAKATGDGGDSWRTLNIWQCGNHWHVGRSKLITPAPPVSVPEKRPSTLEKIKRKIRIIERQWDKQNRDRADMLGKLVEIDKQLGLI